MMKTTVYIIERPTGIVGDDGIELTVLCEARLTRAAAESVRDRKYPGAVVTKLTADKSHE